MKICLRGIWAIIFFLSIASISFAEETIRIAIGEWTPYVSKDLKHYGPTSHIVTEAFALEGIKVEYGFFPWKRSYNIALHGEWDGTNVYNRTAERENVFYISDDPVAEGPLVFFHLKSFSFDWNEMDDLKGIPIGALQGSDYGKAFQNAEEEGKITVQRVTREKQNFAKLLIKRIKIFATNREVGYDTLYKNFPLEEVQLVTNHPKPLRTSYFHLLLSKKVKKNKRMIKLFNKGLKRLKDSGKFDQYWEASRRGEYRKK